MDGENNGKPLLKWDDLGVSYHLRKTPISICCTSALLSACFEVRRFPTGGTQGLAWLQAFAGWVFSEVLKNGGCCL